MPMNWSGEAGQLLYHPFRFKIYNLSLNDRDHFACPLCRPGFEPEFPDKQELTGKGLLVSLCNLAMKIKGYNTKESAANLIVEWCMDNMHPYNIDFIYSELSDEHFDLSSVDGDFIEKDGIFNLDTFLKDLGELYNAVLFYVSLEGFGSVDDAGYKLSPEDWYFVELSYFDVPGYDYEMFREKLIECIPDFTIRLKIDPMTNRMNFSADVQSVFDIAWFTLAKMLSAYPAFGEKVKLENRSEGSMIRCRHCGKFIIRRNSRHEYCDDRDCQKARSARKQKAYRDRRELEESTQKSSPK